MKSYIAYTDGSFQSSINAGGYASIILDEFGNEIVTLYQGFTNTTNNRMELNGVLAVLRYFKDPVSIMIYSDSQYVINSLTNGWAKKWIENQELDKKNLDLFYEILDLMEKHTVTFTWVKGHSTNDYNNLADMLAVHAAQAINIQPDIKTLKA